MSYAKIGLSIGTLAGIIIFFVVWLFPVGWFGGFLGTKLQEMFTGSSQGMISIFTLVLTVFTTCLFVTIFTSFLGWLFGGALNAIFTRKAHIPSMQWCPIGSLKIDVGQTVVHNVIQRPLQWCPKIQ